MKTPKIDLDVDKNMNATLIIECGECRRKNRLSMSQASPGKTIKCTCGGEFSLNNGDLRKIQKYLDSLKRTTDNLLK